MERENKIRLLRIIASAALLASTYFLIENLTVRLIGFVVSYLIAGYDVILESVESIFHGALFDEDFLMLLATVGAFAIGEYPEAVFVMVFFQVGELFEEIAEEKSRRSISSLMDIRPDSANLLDGETVKTVSPETVAVGALILVKPGERIPLDGKIVEGSSALDTSALTGESLPRECKTGDCVLSGCINLSGLLVVEVEKTYGESTVAKILELIENSASSKTKSETFIRKFARWYTPLMVAAAVLVGVVVPLFAGNWTFWLQKACTFLVISCPCALVVSVPLTFFCGIGGASKKGILIKGSNVLETLCGVKTVCFDKTGTLTTGGFRVLQANPADDSTKQQLLYYAAAAEQHSTHPLAVCVKQAHPDASSAAVSDVEELAGHGICATVDGAKILVGKRALMEQNGIFCADAESDGTVLFVAKDKKLLGTLVLGDDVKEDAKAAVTALKKLDVTKTVLLTGDRVAAGNAVAQALSLSDACTELLPQDKVLKVQQLQKENGTTAFVGDGINDAPVLAAADVGVAMGALGSDAAIESADVVLMDDKLSGIPQAIRIARKTNAIAKQNIALSLFIKFSIMALCMLGYAPLAAAVFADVGVLILAVANATRAFGK